MGSFSEDSNATGIGGDDTDNSAPNSGAVYVYSRSGAIWSQQAYIKSSNSEAEDWFSRSLSLSGDGNILAVNSLFEESNATGINGDENDNTASDSGAVYVFVRNGATWSQQAYVKAPNTDSSDTMGGDFTGVSLSGDGSTLAVGAYQEDSNATGVGGDQADNSELSSGAVYVY